MAGPLDYLEEEASKEAAKETVAQLTQRAVALKNMAKDIEAEEMKLKMMKARYIQQSQSLADDFKLNNCVSVTDNNGSVYTVETITSCSIKKEAKSFVALWLINQGASELVKHQFKVTGTEKNRELLEKAGVLFEDETDMNTNSVKAFLLGALGQKESPATITREEIPDGISWYQFDTVKISGAKRK